MNNHTLFTLILLFLVLTALISVSLLSQEIILGYSGFTIFNSKDNLISITSNCSNNYFLAKYNAQTLEKTMRITFICTLVLLLASLVSICIMVLAVDAATQRQSEQRQQTGIEQRNFAQQQPNSQRKLIFYLKKYEQFLVFSSITSSILCSLVIFKKYLQYHQQSNSDICPITISASHIIQIIILSCIVMSFSLITLVFFFIIMCNINRILEVQSIQNQNKSLSFRHQIQQIMREVPQSQRQLRKVKSEGAGNLERQSHEQERQNNQNDSKVKEGQVKQVFIPGMQRVQSIIYNTSPSMLLQSSV